MSEEPETFACPGFNGFGSPEASWGKRDGFRTCSYCGSIHPDDWIAAVQEAITTGGSAMSIDRGKRGKWYARGSEGRRGKFYGYHMPEDRRTDTDLTDQLDRALRASWDRLFPDQKERSAVERLGELGDGR